jgi:hypothetical protein
VWNHSDFLRGGLISGVFLGVRCLWVAGVKLIDGFAALKATVTSDLSGWPKTSDGE